MIDRERLRTIAALALPIVGAMASQNVLNVVDTWFVGHLGDAALAAVGLGSFANFACVAFVTGLSAGVQAMAARRKGEGRDAEMGVALNGGLLLAAGIAIPASVVLFLLVPAVFPYLADDPEVVARGVPYLQARLVAMAAVGMNFSFRGFWNGIGRSRLYLVTLLVIHVVDVFLDWLLIFGHWGLPALGSTGAAIADAVALYVGTALYLVLGWAYARPHGFLRARPDAATLRTMARISVPAGLQQLLFAVGFTVFFWIVGRVGTAELAAANVLLNLTLVAILPGQGLGIAAATLVGQALGRGDAADAKRWGWDVTLVGVAVMSAIGLPMVLAPDAILALFLRDPASAALARAPLVLVGATIGLEAVGLVLLNALLGAGDSRRVMVGAVLLQWGLGLPLTYVVGPVLGGGLLAIWIAQLAYRGLQAGYFSVLWQRGRWAAIRV